MGCLELVCLAKGKVILAATAKAVECRCHVFSRVVDEVVRTELAGERLFVAAACDRDGAEAELVCLRANKDSRPLRYLIFRGSIPHPMQSLCTLRNHCRQWPRNTRYQADATPYLGRAFTGWIVPALCWRTYSITSSARVSSVGGTVRPSILAVSALMTSSNLLACTTGRSTGLAPLTMRPTYTPT